MADTVTLGKLFDAGRFDSLVYVDDEFHDVGVRLQRIADGLSPERLRSIAALEIGEGVPDDMVHRIARGKIDAVTDRAQPLATELLRLSGDRENELDSVFTALLSELPIERRKCFSMAEWKREEKSIMESAKSGSKLLFVFDDDFRREGYSESEGRNVLGGIVAQLGDRPFAAVLLTHKASTGELEQAIAEELAKAAPTTAAAVVVIGKGPIEKDAGELPLRIKYAILKGDFAAMKNEVMKCYKDSLGDGHAAIASLDVEQFERIVVKSSSAEGAWIPDTVSRLVQAYQMRSMRRRLRSGPRIFSLIEKMEPIVALATKSPAGAFSAVANRHQHHEVIESDVTELGLPLALGDVFEVATRRCVLVAQPCDLALRSRGDRGGRDAYKLASLLELRKRSGSASSSAESISIELRHAEPSGDSLIVQFSVATIVPAWVLDWCTYSPSGECELSSDQQLRDNVEGCSARRFSKLREQIESQVMRPVAQLKWAIVGQDLKLGVDEEQRQMLRAMLRLPECPELNPLLTTRGKEWTIKLVGVKRVSRVAERYSVAILTSYAHYLSRPAHPHEYTRA